MRIACGKVGSVDLNMAILNPKMSSVKRSFVLHREKIVVPQTMELGMRSQIQK